VSSYGRRPDEWVLEELRRWNVGSEVRRTDLRDCSRETLLVVGLMANEKPRCRDGIAAAGKNAAAGKGMVSLRKFRMETDQ
jgi:hypothetical protein